jgi:hypothetical protein
MNDAMYCLCSSEPRANAILVHLRNAGFGLEISVFLQDRRDTKEIAPQENAVRGAEIGIAGTCRFDDTRPGTRAGIGASACSIQRCSCGGLLAE